MSNNTMEQQPITYNAPRSKTKEVAQDLGRGGLAFLATLAVVYGGVQAVEAIKAGQEKGEKQDAAMEQAIKPAAMTIAQYVMDHDTAKPIRTEEGYVYLAGGTEDGQTLMSAKIAKVGNESPSAVNVISVTLAEYRSPGKDGEVTGYYTGETLHVVDGEWVATESTDFEAPYDVWDTSFNSPTSKVTSFDHRTFQERLDVAKEIT